jgi:hypothetical protein
MMEVPDYPTPPSISAASAATTFLIPDPPSEGKKRKSLSTKPKSEAEKAEYNRKRREKLAQKKLEKNTTNTQAATITNDSKQARKPTGIIDSSSIRSTANKFNESQRQFDEYERQLQQNTLFQYEINNLLATLGDVQTPHLISSDPINPRNNLILRVSNPDSVKLIEAIVAELLRNIINKSMLLQPGKREKLKLDNVIHVLKQTPALHEIAKSIQAKQLLLTQHREQGNNPNNTNMEGTNTNFGDRKTENVDNFSNTISIKSSNVLDSVLSNNNHKDNNSAAPAATNASLPFPNLASSAFATEQNNLNNNPSISSNNINSDRAVVGVKRPKLS